MSEKLVLYGLIGLIAISPLPFGGNVPWAWALYAVLAAVLAIVYVASALKTRTAFPVPLHRIAAPALLVAAAVIWMALQALPLLPASMAHPLWTLVPEALGSDGRDTVSVNPDATITGLMRLLTYATIFWLSLQLARDRSTGEFLIKAIAWIIAAYAAYGLLVWASGAELVLWYPKEAYRGDLTSTFINRNSFATYVGCGALLFLVLLLRRIMMENADQKDRPFLKRVASFLRSSNGLVWYALPFLATLSALLLTHSRAGFGATFIAMAIAYAIWQFRQHRGFVIGMLGLAIFVVVTGYWIVLGGDALLSRFADVNSATETRINVYLATLRAIGDHFWAGSGHGTFSDMFPLYRDDSISADGLWDKAHNTYLELLLGLGVPAGAALIAAVIWLVALCGIGAFNRRRGRHMPVIALCVSVLVGLHALVDFSLQMAGVAVTYAAILGIGVAQSYSSRNDH